MRERLFTSSTRYAQGWLYSSRAIDNRGGEKVTTGALVITVIVVYILGVFIGYIVGRYGESIGGKPS